MEFKDSQALSPLATPGATRGVLEKHGLYTKHSFGQNFLVSDAVLRHIVTLADVQPTDVVLEVGPGIGTLSIALLKNAGHVIAVECDTDLPQVLEDTLETWWDRFSLLNMDALNLRESDLQSVYPTLPNKFVANLPYAVAATLVLDYFQRFDFLDSATVMVQKEVADRMTAAPGSKIYGAYTVKLSLYAKPVDRFPVSPGNFFPPPHVESSVVRFDRCRPCAPDGHLLTAEEKSAVCLMADAAFASRRKTIANSFHTYFASRNEKIDIGQLCARTGIDGSVRGETLSLTDFINLGTEYLAFAKGGSAC